MPKQPAELETEVTGGEKPSGDSRRSLRDMLTSVPQQYDPEMQNQIIGSHHTLESVTAQISDIALKRPISLGWLISMFVSLSLLALMFVSVMYLILEGVGIWGVNVPVGWGVGILSFVWWIGIGHAGTLISAILLLLHQNWRTSINRFAEAMTLMAVCCAGLYPLLHVGRHQYVYWMLPFPNTMGLWPQFRSPLIWDVFAVSTYFTVSLVFWYIGLVPDLATMRDRAKAPWLKKFIGFFALGWRYSTRHWQRYNAVYLILAGLSTPLVLSVHTTVSWDFAAGIVPGWHGTIFPQYFVAGAVYAGFAMVINLGVPLRSFFRMKDLITMKHLENCGKFMCITGNIVFYGYIMEVFTAWYSGVVFERYLTFDNRMFGPYAWSFWLLIFCNGVFIQLIWFKKIRTSIWGLYIVALVVNFAMWLERLVLIPFSLTRDYLPSSWHMYYPSFWDYATFAGTLGLFFTLFFIFVRLLPTISMVEMRELVHHEHHVDELGANDPAVTGGLKV